MMNDQERMKSIREREAHLDSAGYALYEHAVEDRRFLLAALDEIAAAAREDDVLSEGVGDILIRLGLLDER